MAHCADQALCVVLDGSCRLRLCVDRRRFHWWVERRATNAHAQLLLLLNGSLRRSEALAKAHARLEIVDLLVGPIKGAVLPPSSALSAMGEHGHLIIDASERGSPVCTGYSPDLWWHACVYLLSKRRVGTFTGPIVTKRQVLLHLAVLVFVPA